MAAKVCSIPNCERPIRARGWCLNHYMLWRRNGVPKIVKKFQAEQCAVKGCNRIPKAKGLCGKHYQNLNPKRHLSSHGMTSRTGGASKEYRTWSNMISRCYHPSHYSYKNYGGRGIAVCKQWRESVIPFYEHIGRCPSARHSIDRIDGKRGYEPGNVRWATPHEQAQNRSTNTLTPELVRAVRRVRKNGASVMRWAADNGVKYTTALSAANGVTWGNI